MSAEESPAAPAEVSEVDAEECLEHEDLDCDATSPRPDFATNFINARKALRQSILEGTPVTSTEDFLQQEAWLQQLEAEGKLDE
jgi:hypothetical protein